MQRSVYRCCRVTWWYTAGSCSGTPYLWTTLHGGAPPVRMHSSISSASSGSSILHLVAYKGPYSLSCLILSSLLQHSCVSRCISPLAATYLFSFHVTRDPWWTVIQWIQRGGSERGVHHDMWMSCKHFRLGLAVMWGTCGLLSMLYLPCCAGVFSRCRCRAGHTAATTSQCGAAYRPATCSSLVLVAATCWLEGSNMTESRAPPPHNRRV